MSIETNGLGIKMPAMSTASKSHRALPTRAEILAQYHATAEAIGELLHPHAEIVIHDLVTGCIAYIVNAFSKRVVGDTSLIDDGPEMEADGPVLGPYEKDHADGRSLRSITIVIKDFDDQQIGFMCVNLDLTPFDNVRKAVETLLQFNPASAQPASLFAKDWREKINGVTAHFLRERSCTLGALSKIDRIDLVRRIDAAGLFEARGAAEYAARQLDVSRAALYRYLTEARNG